MDDSKTVAPLRKALSLLDNDLSKLSALALKQKRDWEDTITQVNTIRQQRTQVEATIKMLGGVVEDKPISTDQELVAEIARILAQSPRTLKELKDLTQARGFKSYGVSKALTGPEFIRTPDRKFTLSRLVYGVELHDTQH